MQLMMTTATMIVENILSTGMCKMMLEWVRCPSKKDVLRHITHTQVKKMNDCDRCGVQKGLSVYDGICRACNDELFVVFWEGQ